MCLSSQWYYCVAKFKLKEDRRGGVSNQPNSSFSLCHFLGLHPIFLYPFSQSLHFSAINWSLYHFSSNRRRSSVRIDTKTNKCATWSTSSHLSNAWFFLWFWASCYALKHMHLGTMPDYITCDIYHSWQYACVEKLEKKLLRRHWHCLKWELRHLEIQEKCKKFRF